MKVILLSNVLESNGNREFNDFVLQIFFIILQTIKQNGRQNNCNRADCAQLYSKQSVQIFLELLVCRVLKK